MNALWYVAGVAVAWALILAYRFGRASGVRRERANIVAFFSRTTTVLRLGEPGPIPGVLVDPHQVSRIASFLDHEGDEPYLRARFESRGER